MPASGMRAPADNPRRVRVRASWREASSLEKRPRPLLAPAGVPPEPADTTRQFTRGTHMVRGDEASTFLRLTWSCLICQEEGRGGEARVSGEVLFVLVIMS